MNIHIWQGFGGILMEVIYALLPLLLLFIFFQFFLLKLPVKRLIDIGIGFLLAFLGLSLFLQGVHIGFLPIGEMIGESLGSLNKRWILLMIGFVIGFFAIYAEPAVNVLIKQVDKVSSGYIPRKVLLYTLSTGVGVAVSLSMIRIIYGISIWYFLLPGYLLGFILIKFSSKTFTAIAFDSGGVATGPMTATFILALFVGLATAMEGRDPLLEGFGMVALVALAPIIAVLTLGTLYSRKEKQSYVREQAEADHHNRPERKE